MNEGVGGTDQLAITIGVERITGDHFTCSGQPGFRTGAHQYANSMSTFEKDGNESVADIARSPRDEDSPGVGRFGQ